MSYLIENLEFLLKKFLKIHLLDLVVIDTLNCYRHISVSQLVDTFINFCSLASTKLLVQENFQIAADAFDRGLLLVKVHLLFFHK